MLASAIAKQTYSLIIQPGVLKISRCGYPYAADIMTELCWYQL